MKFWVDTTEPAPAADYISFDNMEDAIGAIEYVLAKQKYDIECIEGNLAEGIRAYFDF